MELPVFRHLCVVLLLALPAAANAQAEFSNPYDSQEISASSAPSWMDRLFQIPLLRLFAPAAVAAPESMWLFSALPLVPAVPDCLVLPLPPVSDPEAVGFEAQVGSSGVVQTEGMMPEAQHALFRFEQVIASVGGTITITSAYRPPAYQEHLQAVWDKWMEIRRNSEDGCQTLKAQVAEEFARHELLETQRPVSYSDHTRGFAFDAAVSLPRRARVGKRRATVDRLARMAGVMRPAIAADPVHFRLVAAR